MLDQLDAHIFNRLSIVLHEGSPVKVFDYLPERELGHTEYPCYAFQHHDIDLQEGDARPHCELFIPSVTQETIHIQHELGGGEASGPISYTWKPFPTPVTLIYEIQALATARAHAAKLKEGIFQVFPPGYQPLIEGQAILFTYGKPFYMDRREKPEFRIGFILSLHDVWLERAELATFKPIKTVTFETGTIQ